MTPYGQQPPPGYPPGHGFQGAYQQGAPQRNTKALIAFYCAIATILTCGLAGIFALIFGILAQKEIKASRVPVPNAWMALVGLILGGIGFVTALLAIGAAVIPRL